MEKKRRSEFRLNTGDTHASSIGSHGQRPVRSTSVPIALATIGVVMTAISCNLEDPVFPQGATGTEGQLNRVGVIVNSVGSDPPGQGYVYTALLTPVGSTSSRTGLFAVGQQGSTAWDDVQSGSYALELTNAPENCEVQGDNPTMISAGLGSNTVYTFTVLCVPHVGSIHLFNVTDGDPMVQGFVVNVSDITGGLRLSSPGSNLFFNDVPVGDSEVVISGIPDHCFLVGQPTIFGPDVGTRVVSVSFGQRSSLRLHFDCTLENGVLRVTTRTTGGSLDKDGYFVTVGSETIGFADNFSYDFGPLSPTDHEVLLFDVADNCVVLSADPVPGDPDFFETEETVVVNDVTEIVIDIDCSGTPSQFCVGLPNIGLGDATFTNADWNTKVAYQTNQNVQWTVTQAGQKTTPGPGAVPEGLPDTGRWVQMSLNNPGGLATGVGVASEHIPARIPPGGLGSIHAEFFVWANSAAVQAYIKDTTNNTYYGLPPRLIVSQADGWVRIDTGCVQATNLSKIGGQTGQGDDTPDVTHEFEIGYFTAASGPATVSVRDIVVDGWTVRVWGN